MQAEERSYERITIDDMKRLGDLALEDLEDFFRRFPRHKPYKNHLILTALCQGVALHYIDGKTGVKDFDVWSFFTDIPSVRFPYRRHRIVESGLEKFGVHSIDIGWNYKSRHVDLFGGTIKADIVKRNRGDPCACITEYLKRVKTTRAKKLGRKLLLDYILKKFWAKYFTTRIARDKPSF